MDLHIIWFVLLGLILAGYAVLDDASMPVVGTAEKANDTFVEQIVASAKVSNFACSVGSRMKFSLDATSSPQIADCC